MASIGIIGAGAVGQALAQRLWERGYEVYLVKRPHQRMQMPVHVLTSCQDLPWPALQALLLCVKDRQIQSLSEAIRPVAPPHLPVAHTAGSVSIETLGTYKQRGVVYPLQSFSAGMPVKWGTFPIFWEGPEVFEHIAQDLAMNAQQVFFADSFTRLEIHLGAVFAANFTNALVQIAQTIIGPRWGHEIYMPLLETVVAKLHRLSPREAQTGPARRGDEETLRQHIAYLQEKWPQAATIYALLSQFITKM